MKLNKCEFWSVIKEIPAHCINIGLEGCEYMTDLYAAASSNLINEELVEEYLYDTCNVYPDVRNLSYVIIKIYNIYHRTLNTHCE